MLFGGALTSAAPYASITSLPVPASSGAGSAIIEGWDVALFILFGTRGYAKVLAMVTFVCNHCHNPAAQRVLHRTTKFTLFFLPLFPVSSTYSTTCTFCGQGTKITKELAEQYVTASARQQSGGAYGPAQEQLPTGQQQYGQPQNGPYGQYGQPQNGQYGANVQPQNGQYGQQYGSQQ